MARARILKVNYLIVLEDKMYGNDESFANSFEVSSFASIESKVRAIAVKELESANEDADMEDRYEIKNISISVDLF